MAGRKSELIGTLKRLGLEEYYGLIRAGLEPAVRLSVGRIAKRPLIVGRSKFGGEPHLHEPADWPTNEAGWPLQFLAQIRLSDLPSGHGLGHLLPHRGYLWFWEDRLGLWLEQNTRLKCDWRAGYRVTFSPDERRPLVRCACPTFVEPSIPKRKRLWHYEPPAFKAGPEAAMRLESVMSVHFEALQRLFASVEKADPEHGWEQADEFYRVIHGEKPGLGNHRLLGDVYELMADSLGSNMRAYCVESYKARRAGRDLWERPPGLPYKPPARSEIRQWRLLAEFEDDERLDWFRGGCARLYFWIREQDLAKRDFSKVCGYIDGD